MSNEACVCVESRDRARRVDAKGFGVYGARDIEGGESTGVRSHERREQHEEYHQDENHETFGYPLKAGHLYTTTVSGF